MSATLQPHFNYNFNYTTTTTITTALHYNCNFNYSYNYNSYNYYSYYNYYNYNHCNFNNINPTTTTTTNATTALHHTSSRSCEWGDHCNHCNHSKKHNSNHLSVHQWIRSAIHASKQRISPIASYPWNFRHRLVRYYWKQYLITLSIGISIMVYPPQIWLYNCNVFKLYLSRGRLL